MVQGLSKRFGGTVAVSQASFEVAAGERVGIIGPNGAGKTTLFEMISGFLKPDSGRTIFAGLDVSRWSPERRSRLGLVRSFQNARMFETLTVRETVELAASTNRRPPDIDHLLRSLGLTDLSTQPLSVLPTGSRRIVELGANLAMSPRLLLLDEPSAGVSQAETDHLAHVLDTAGTALGASFVIIEHDVALLTHMCDTMLAMETGRVIASGTPAEVTSHPAVIRSYLGTTTDGSSS